MFGNLWLRIKRHILPYPLAFIGKYSIKVILWTCKVNVKGLEEFKTAASQGNCILMIWHNRIALTCEFFKHYAPEISYSAFLSKSRDGEPIARIILSYRNGNCIRVAHQTRHNALREVIYRLKKSKDLVVITPDGPRGPRYKIKEGIVLAAKATEAKIIPYTWEANKYWQFKTWDQFRIPRPFTTITIALGSPFVPQADSSSSEVLSELEKSFQILDNSLQ